MNESDMSNCAETNSVDRIYLGACAWDGRLTRICAASIRYFYPDVPIQVLAGDILERGLAAELKKYWNVDVADLPRGDFGSGFVKLEPLFGPAGQRFMVVDVDTVFSGKVLDAAADATAPFVVDDENLGEADLKRLYFDWDALRQFDRNVQPAWRAFNTGQWFGVAGVLKRSDFDPWVVWTMPRRLKYPQHFMTGDQGIQNYVLLQKAAQDASILDRRKIMRWPGHAMDDMGVNVIAAGTAPARVVHWAGMKATFLHQMANGDILQFFENYYYSRMPFSRLRQRLGVWRHVRIHVTAAIRRRVQLRMRATFGAPQAAATEPLVTTSIPS
jgi:hypothetical protein